MSPSIPDDDLERIVSRVVRQLADQPQATDPAQSPAITIAIGADHRGQALKDQLVAFLREGGYAIRDHSQRPDGSTDYPDIAEAVANDVASGAAWRGIVIDGAGIGSCMAANKVPGVRAALCYNHATASNSREHNDANVLSLGSGLTGPALAQMILETWLNTPFAGGRHARRVDKISAIERRHSRRGS
jgi:ribose 5-phosphate isomerase B